MVPSPRALRILFFCEQYPPVVWDGAGTYTSVLATALARIGHDVHVLCAQGRHVVDAVVDGVHVHRRPLLRVQVSRALGPLGARLAGHHYPRDSITLRASLPLSYTFWMHRLALHPDVIETQDGETRGLIQALRHSRPLVIHMHCPTMHSIRLSGERLGVKGMLADRLDRASSDLADGVTSPSQLLVDTLRETGWLSNREVEIIPNPFDAAPWQHMPTALQTTPTIAAVGRLESHKGVDVLLDASARLRKSGVAHTLVLAGGPAGFIDGVPSGRWLADRARRLGVDAHFTGHLPADKLTEVYAQARVVAVPSRFESFSIAATEGNGGGSAGGDDHPHRGRRLRGTLGGRIGGAARRPGRARRRPGPLPARRRTRRRNREERPGRSGRTQPHRDRQTQGIRLPPGDRRLPNPRRPPAPDPPDAGPACPDLSGQAGHG